MITALMKQSKFTLFALILLILFCFSANGFIDNREEVAKIKTYLLGAYAEKSEFPRRFIYDMVDLNNDGKEEYVIGLMGPDFCGTGGCTMLILSHDLKSISKTTLVNYPIYLSSEDSGDTNKGYKNIYLRTGQVGYVKLVWNGDRYPGNPSTQPNVPESDLSGKTAYLKAEDDPAFDF
jgi:hypothetical protein